MSSRFMTLAGLAAVAAIALAWSAFAADDGNGDRNGDGQRQNDRWSMPVPPPPGGGQGEASFRFHGPPPHGPIGPEGGELTWGELHVQRDGEAVTLRVDHGEIASVGSDSITVGENDGNEVEIPVDGDTKVMAGPLREADLGDLEEGDEVHVVREEGQPAEKIGVLPDRDQLPPMLERAPEAAPGGGE